MTTRIMLLLSLLSSLAFMLALGCGSYDTGEDPTEPCTIPEVTSGPTVQVDSFSVRITMRTDIVCQGRITYEVEGMAVNLVTWPDTVHVFEATHMDYGSIHDYTYRFWSDYCGFESGIGTFPTPHHPQVDTDAGWTAYEDGRYEDASTLFDVAVRKTEGFWPARIGMAWTYLARRGVGENGRVGEFLTTYPDSVHSEIYAAIAFSQSVTELPPSYFYTYPTVDIATALIEHDPHWVFSHNTEIDTKDLTVLICQEYFLDGDYEEALTWVRTLDPAFTADMDTPVGVAALSIRIEELCAMYCSF